jgi:hypothetical protein
MGALPLDLHPTVSSCPGQARRTPPPVGVLTPPSDGPGSDTSIQNSDNLASTSLP